MGARPARGYTLIEMAVVVVIISILFSVVAVRFDTLTDDSRLRASAREVGDTVALAFSQALVTRKKHTLVFDTESGVYCEDGEPGSEQCAAEPRRGTRPGLRVAPSQQEREQEHREQE